MQGAGYKKSIKNSKVEVLNTDKEEGTFKYRSDRRGSVSYTNPISSYRETRVKTASQGQLIIMLYEEALRQMDLALDVLTADEGGGESAASKNSVPGNPSKIEKVSKSILKTQEIITELTASLDFEKGGAIATNLFSLYTWFNKELFEANVHQDIQRLMVIRGQLSDLKSAWVEILPTNNADNVGKAIAGVNIAG